MKHPELPKDYVLLGKKGEFEVPRNEPFRGYYYCCPTHHPDTWQYNNSLWGNDDHWIYAAHKDSEIAKLNGLSPLAEETANVAPKLEFKVGRKYLTRDGRVARVLATDLENHRPIVVALRDSGGEYVTTLYEAGNHLSNGSPYRDDLVAVYLDFDCSCLPKWANYIFCQCNGSWVWSIERPVLVKDAHFYSYNGTSGSIPKAYTPKGEIEWTESLIMRPESVNTNQQ